MLNESLISKDERMNAALAHASIVLGFFSRGVLGVVLAFLLWITQRGKSKFAARQAAQALVYQLIAGLIILWTFMSWGILFAGSIFVPVLFNSENPEPMMPYTMIPAGLFIIVPFAMMFFLIGYGLYAAWQVWHGKDFSYPIIGRWFK